MIRVVSMLSVLAVLAACGADGEPIRPTLTGAVSIGSGGIYPSVGVGVSKGPVSVYVGG